MDKEKVIAALNHDLALELAAITQYMWQHVMARGIYSPAFRDRIKAIAIDEMKHAEALAERIVWLGGTPITEPTHIHVGGDLGKMTADDIKAEREAIQTYREQLELVKDDPVTHRLLVKLIEDEEEHLDFFESLTEGPAA